MSTEILKVTLKFKMLLRKPLGDYLGIYDYEDKAVPHLKL